MRHRIHQHIHSVCVRHGIYHPCQHLKSVRMRHRLHLALESVCTRHGIYHTCQHLDFVCASHCIFVCVSHSIIVCVSHYFVCVSHYPSPLPAPEICVCVPPYPSAPRFCVCVSIKPSAPRVCVYARRRQTLLPHLESVHARHLIHQHLKSVCMRRDKGWQRCIGSLQLQVFFRKRVTIYRALLQKMTNKDKASIASSPPCIYHPCKYLE